MAKGYNRAQRVEDVIQTALAEIVQRESENLRFGMVTIVDVTIARDLSFAKIFVSVFDDAKAKQTIEVMNQEAKYLRFELAKAVKLRIMPELRFVYDDSTVKGHRISSLLNQALKDKK